MSALVENKVMCMHGGLSPKMEHIDELNSLDRFTEVPHEGCICDLLWSDPSEPEDTFNGWKHSNRGAGYIFGEQ